MSPADNVDENVIEDFGAEWSRFDQSQVDSEELRAIFDAYFHIFPWDILPVDPVGFDLGAGSGRWAQFVAPRVGELHIVEPSAAIDVARRLLCDRDNVVFHHEAADDMSLGEASMDFGYSLGVLHHVPDTERALRSCVRVLKPGAPFLLYLYYAFDNQPAWYRALWRVSEVGRRTISSLDGRSKQFAADAIAAGVYFPLARSARILERFGVAVQSFPLSSYRDKSFYTMRTDALDRFGTRLEKRYTADEVRSLMEGAGLGGVKVSSEWPYWCALGFRAR